MVISCFAMFMSFVSYKLEFYQKYDDRILVTCLTIQMVCSFMNFALLICKKKLIIKRMIARKELRCHIGILTYYNNTNLFLEMLFIILHPSPFLIGIRIEQYNSLLGTYIFYHINDYLTIILSLKACYLYTTYLINTSNFSTDRAYRVCNMFGACSSWMFVIRCTMKEQAIKCQFWMSIFGV